MDGLSSVWHHRAMNTSPTADLYKRHRFSAEIISHCVWLYYRFSLSPTRQRKQGVGKEVVLHK
jgi:transposase-like protein